MAAFRRMYEVAFSNKYLLYTNLTVAFSLTAVGDTIDQKIEIYRGKRLKWDRRRTFNTAVAGMCSGVVSHYWYKWLDVRLKGTDLITVLKKILLDEIICSPVYIAVFFAVMGYMDGRDFNDILHEMRIKMWRVYRFDWMIWPPAQFINFYYLPTQFRVLYVFAISIVYLTYTSHITHEVD